MYLNSYIIFAFTVIGCHIKSYCQVSTSQLSKIISIYLTALMSGIDSFSKIVFSICKTGFINYYCRPKH